MKLEKHYKDMQDIEFTIERGKLYMLQTRNGKRTGAAAVKMAVDMVKEKLITRKTALKRIPAERSHPAPASQFPGQEQGAAKMIAKGLPASPGAASGALAFTAEEAVERARAASRSSWYARRPPGRRRRHAQCRGHSHLHGWYDQPRGRRRPWLGQVLRRRRRRDRDRRRKGTITVGGKTYGRKSVLSIDGSTGEVMVGEIERVVPSKVSGDLATVLKWADDERENGRPDECRYAQDAKRAREFGAIGIGLCRTEHMFFEGDRIKAMRQMILANTTVDREKALKKLLPYQRKDFAGIFTAMKGLPVTVRLLDPPLHEFLPHDVDAQKAMAKDLGVSFSEVKRRVSMLHEMNPMLGHRGCRLAITYPEIATMQARAITEATIQCLKKGVKARPEIMVPLIGTRRELEILRELILDTIATVKKEKKYTGKLDIPVGTMIEIPRAALTAGEVAEVADFFSFGTNDLTQMAFGYSRDDAGVFLPEYVSSEILEKDPFQSIDATGVGSSGGHRLPRGATHGAGAQARHLRRARRRSGVDHVLREGRARLRELLAVQSAGGEARCRSGGPLTRGPGPPMAPFPIRFRGRRPRRLPRFFCVGSSIGRVFELRFGVGTSSAVRQGRKGRGWRGGIQLIRNDGGLDLASRRPGSRTRRFSTCTAEESHGIPPTGVGEAPDERAPASPAACRARLPAGVGGEASNQPAADAGKRVRPAHRRPEPSSGVRRRLPGIWSGVEGVARRTRRSSRTSPPVAPTPCRRGPPRLPGVPSVGRPAPGSSRSAPVGSSSRSKAAEHHVDRDRSR